MKLYTTTGDDGHTSLINGERVPKDDPRVDISGKVDELNSLLGWCRCAAGAEDFDDRLDQLQQELFHVGVELATPPEALSALGIVLISEAQGRRLEQWIDEAVDAVDPLQNFVLPGGTELACRFHITRTRCRALERVAIGLSRTFPVRSEMVVYLNRLGDLLFAWSRLANHKANRSDHIWKPKK